MLMKVQFSIEYRTSFGEELFINILLHKNEKGKTEEKVVKMMTTDGLQWNTEIVFDAKSVDYVDYYYCVNHNGEDGRSEWTVVPHRLDINNKYALIYKTNDIWIDNPIDSYLYSSAYTDCAVGERLRPSDLVDYNHTICLKVRATQLRKGDCLAIVGDDKLLGEWNTRNALPMTEHHCNEWIVTLDADKLSRPIIEYKFIVLNKKDISNIIWENGINHTLDINVSKPQTVEVFEIPPVDFPIAKWKIAGSVIPVFSIRTKDSFCVGDFGDLKKMIDWVALTHQKILQVLPINDTTQTCTWRDSYPYSCISIFALHPQYADFHALPSITDEKAKAKFNKIKKELNALPQIDYERVNEAKREYLAILFEQEGKKMMQSKEYKTFFSENKEWLVPYAQYRYLSKLYKNSDFNKWPDHHVFDEKERTALESTRGNMYKNVAIYYFVQFILNTQMEAVHDYARSKGVILKGDIPIGVNRCGCDVWTEPTYFNLNGQAGAPPDAFSTNGQNWGFPTYNWDEMLKDDCRWWVRRFSNRAKFFDAYRIDHVLGFFRIWEIPIDAVHGLLGQFAPSLAMTKEEIEAYGLHFQEKLFTEPFIADWVVNKIFGKHADEVCAKYLEHTHDDMYRMKVEYNTQRKVEAAFEGKTSADDVWIRDGLYALISNVLFLRDHKNPNKYHPRISVQYDFVYQALYDSDKFIFNKIYNDYYYRRNNQFWYKEAMKKLPKLVQATRMLVCAEDLGMVPDCVSWVMNELRILSLELQSMPKDSHVRFGHLSQNPYRSVCTISSHDTATLRQWWDEDNARTQEYYSTMLYRGGDAPHPLPGWLAKDIISRHLTCPSMLCILTLQDWLAIDDKLRLPDQNGERINIPANPHHYWRYRMHLNVEDLIGNKECNNEITELISQSSRK